MNEEQLDLSRRKCLPCSGLEPPITGDRLNPYMASLSFRWTLSENNRLVRTFKFKDFKSALLFTNSVGSLAEAEGHHPVIELAWGRVKISLWSHNINGLSENDFILASKIEKLGVE